MDSGIYAGFLTISIIKQKELHCHDCNPFIFSIPGETRTLDPLIKSQLLYQLSYGDGYAKVINIYTYYSQTVNFRIPSGCRTRGI